MANSLNTTPAVIRHKIESVRVINDGCGNYSVTATAVYGAGYHLRHKFTSHDAAHSVAAKIAIKGTIDVALWDMVSVKPNSIAARRLASDAAKREPRAFAA